MAKGSVQIELDPASKANLERQFAALGTTIAEAGTKAIFKILIKIKTEAQLRLIGRGHIVTSRLANSMRVKMNGLDNSQSKTYSDNSTPPQTYNNELTTVNLKDNLEGAVGTNVEYATKIELLDSYLYWALKNVDVTKGVMEDMQNDIKFGSKLGKK